VNIQAGTRPRHRSPSLKPRSHRNSRGGRRPVGEGQNNRFRRRLQSCISRLGHNRRMTWDPDQHHLFPEERWLPFRHLLAAAHHLQPALVVDLGCGSGALTKTLIERWPSARITGIDSSGEMIAHAQRREIPGRLRFEIGDVATWCAPEVVDLLLSNACFHWIDGRTPFPFRRLFIVTIRQ